MTVSVIPKCTGQIVNVLVWKLLSKILGVLDLALELKVMHICFVRE